MKRLLLAILVVLTSLVLPASAAEKAGTAVIQPGDTLYLRFEMAGKKLKLVSSTKEKDEGAQVVFTFQVDAQKAFNQIKVENKFDQDLTYKAEARSLTLKKKMIMPTTPVVTGKVAFEDFPKLVEQLALFDFRLVK